MACGAIGDKDLCRSRRKSRRPDEDFKMEVVAGLGGAGSAVCETLGFPESVRFLCSVMDGTSRGMYI